MVAECRTQWFALALVKLHGASRASSYPQEERSSWIQLLDLPHVQALPGTTPRTSHSKNSQLSWQPFLDSFSTVQGLLSLLDPQTALGQLGMAELKFAQMEAEMNQCKDAGAVGHLSDLSKTDLGAAHKVAMFIDESQPNDPAAGVTARPEGFDNEPYPHEPVTGRAPGGDSGNK